MGRRTKYFEGLLFLSLLLVAGVPLQAGMSISLTPSLDSPAPVGTLVRWDATAANADPGTLWYRFRSRAAGGEYKMIRDYGPNSSLDWTASEHEGLYEIELSVRNLATGETSATSAVYQLTSRLADNTPVISPTANPLVFLFSAPPCPDGSQMRVSFAASDGVVQRTPFKACSPDLSMNFYLAGMRTGAAYSVTHTVQTGADSTDGPTLTLTTPEVSLQLAGYDTVQPATQPSAEGILLQSTLFETTVATDLSGNLVWYYPGDLSFLTRPAPGGYFFGIYEDPTTDPSHQVVRELDLAGTTVLETNAARINEQLAAQGKRSIGGFHHEARLLPDGNILVLANTEQIMTDVQGQGPVDILGDMILVLDPNLQVVWTWDAFDHLDPYRKPVLGETCGQLGGGCPPFYLAPKASDWLHGNSVERTPDGNLLYSARHQDWLIKIAYQDGAGSGDVIWRLGQGGDFVLSSADPQAWFSHQHDAGFAPGLDSLLTVFDNGNTRRAADPSAHSRGQALHLDEDSRVASLVLNADLGVYSLALGSAQRLPNGNYHFDAGWIAGNPPVARSVEVDASGNILYDIQVATPEYRSFRMSDLYTTPEERLPSSPSSPSFRPRLPSPLPARPRSLRAN